MALPVQSTFVVRHYGPPTPERERPIHRLREVGTYGVSDAELLALVLRQDTLDTAYQLLNAFSSLNALAHATDEQLAAFPGIGLSTAAALRAALELGRRTVHESHSGQYQVSNPSIAAEYLIPFIGHREQECFVILYLNTRNRITEHEILYRGSLNTSLVRTAEVFRGAVRRNSAAIIAAHNHPSGDPQPSPEDIALTRRLVQAGQLVEIEILDHLIIAHNRHVSLRERQLGFDAA